MVKTYYKKQTQQAIENFPFPLHKTHIELIYSIVTIKKAAAMANTKSNLLSQKIADAVVQACDEILKGKFNDQFMTISLQGGAGTSINMNANEVIATLTEEILHDGTSIHPNDHINLSQSTNDVNPSALKLTCISLVKTLIKKIDNLEKALIKKSKQYKGIKKLARTHLQDAVPTTVGDELLSYHAIIQRDKKRIQDCLPNFYDLNLGGTAIGNSLNASKTYREIVYKELKVLTKFSIKPAENLMSQTSGQADFCQLSALLTIFSMDISKIANDIRFLASGPNGGIGEFILPALQNGSSIMPGKVNPIIPESINQVYYFVSGKNMTVHEAAHNACLELGIMFPVLADSLITMLKLIASAVDSFTTKCIDVLEVNEKRCIELLEKSTAYATLLTPELGYDKVSLVVKQAIKENKTIRQIIFENKILTEDKFNLLTNISD